MSRFAPLLLALAACRAPAATSIDTPPPPEDPYERARWLEGRKEWSLALRAWQDYETRSTCGNCRISKERIQREGFYRCLMALDCASLALNLYVDAWLAHRMKEFGPTFPREIVDAAWAAGRTEDLVELLENPGCPTWTRIATYLRILQLRRHEDVDGLLSLYLELTPYDWNAAADWNEFKEGPSWMAAEAADRLASLSPRAWDLVLDEARKGTHRTFWALVVLARMRDDQRTRPLLDDLRWLPTLSHSSWLGILRAISEAP